MPKTLRQIVLEATYEALIRHNGNRTHVSQELAISIRTVRNNIHAIQRMGYTVPKGRSQSGIEHLMRELEEFRTGKRKLDPNTDDYCHACGRIKTEVPKSPHVGKKEGI